MKKLIPVVILISSYAFAGEPATSYDGNVGIGYTNVKNNALLVRSGSHTEDEFQISTTVQIQKYSHQGDNIYKNPKALRAINIVYPGVSASEWGISGELVSYTDERSSGNTATSGVALKYGRGQVFGGHFQAKDLTGANSIDPISGGSIVGAEINLVATGDDDYVTPKGYPGVRIGLDMPAHTLDQDSNRGKYAAGIRVHNSQNGGVWKKGIHVYDFYGSDFGEEPMEVGVEVTTSGENSILVNGSPLNGVEVDTDGLNGINIIGNNSISSVSLNGTSPYGIRVSGSYSNAAIVISAGSFISLDITNQIKFRYETGRIQFYHGTTKIGYLATNATENKRLN